MAFTPMGSLRSKSHVIVHHRDPFFVIWIRNNYINPHLNFHWKVIGGSQVQNLLLNDQQINSDNSQQVHRLSLFVHGHINCPSYSLHLVKNLFNQWNIWTFGNMKFRKKINTFRKHYKINALDYITHASKVEGKRSLYINDKLVSDVIKLRGNSINNFPDNSVYLNSVQTGSNLGKLIQYYNESHPTKLDILCSINYHLLNTFKSNYIMINGKKTNVNNSDSTIPATDFSRSGTKTMDNNTSKDTCLNSVDLEIQLHPDLERFKVAEVLHNSAELRSDVRESADAYNIVLTDEQNRSDV